MVSLTVSIRREIVEMVSAKKLLLTNRLKSKVLIWKQSIACGDGANDLFDVESCRF